MNYNQVLGVDNNASALDIKKAFRSAAMEIHPDHSDSPEAAEAFSRIKLARDELLKRAHDAEAARDTAGVNNATNSALNATARSGFATSKDDDLFDGYTPEEIKHIQKLDDLIFKKPKQSLFHRSKEAIEVTRHRKKIRTANNRIMGKY